MVLTTFENDYAGINLNIADSASPVTSTNFDGFISDAFTLQFRMIDAEASSGNTLGYTPYTSYIENNMFDTSAFSFGFNALANQFEFHTSDGFLASFDASSINMADSQPHLFSLGFDSQAGELSLNVDGNQLGSESLTSLDLNGAGTLVFGQSLSDFSNSTYDNSAFNADAGGIVLQEISVFDSLLSQTQMSLDTQFGSSPYASDTSMVHHWDLASAHADILADIVSGNIVQLEPTAVVGGRTAITLPDAGVQLNTTQEANSDMVLVDGFEGFAATPFTLQVDFASATELEDESFIGLVSYAETGSDNALLIGMRDADSFQVYAEGIGFVQFNYDLNSLMDGGQHSLSLVVDPDTNEMTLFVDGRSLGTKEFTGEMDIQGGGVLVFGQEQDRVGGGFDQEQAFEGAITQALVYNDLRTADEIASDLLTEENSLDDQNLVSAWNFEPTEEGVVEDLVGSATATAVTEELGTAIAAPELANFGTGLTVNNGDATGQSAKVEGFEGFASSGFTFEMSFASVMNINDGYKALMSYAEMGNDNAFTIGTNHGGSIMQVHAASIGSVEFDIDAWGLMDGNAHNLAISVDNDSQEMSLYVDGNLVSTQTLPEPLTIQGGGTLVFGQEQDFVGGGFDADQEFSGTYFDAALFNDVRSAEEIAADVENGVSGSEENLYANWTFEADSVVENVSGGIAEVDLEGTTSVEVNDLMGGIELNMDQTDQRLEVQNYSGFETGQTTLEVAFSSTMDLGGGFTPLLSYAEGSYDNALTVGFAHNASSLQVHLKDQPPINFGINAADLMDGNNHEIALTFDEAAGQLGLYIDGNYIGELPMKDMNISGGGTLVFGQEQDSLGGGFSSDQIFQGKMHEVRVFDEIRTSEEIYEDAQNGVDSVSEPNLTSHWDMQMDRDLEIDDLVGSQSLTTHNIDLSEEAIPEFMQIDYADLSEGAGEGTVVATVHVQDVNWDAVTLQMVNDHDGMFVVDSASGEIRVAEGRVLDADAQEFYTLEVEALENGVSVGATQVINITVADQQEIIQVDGEAYVNFGSAGDTIYGLAADDNNITGDAGDNLILGDQDATSFGQGGNDILIGGEGNDEIYGQGGDDVIDGGIGNDYIEANQGNDYIYGGEGSDTVQYYGNINDFAVEYDGDSETFTIIDNKVDNGDEGQDIVSGVENFMFNDNGNVVSLTEEEMIALAEQQSALNGNVASVDNVNLKTGYTGTIIIETEDGRDITLKKDGEPVTVDQLEGLTLAGLSNTDAGGFEVLMRSETGEEFTVWTIDNEGNYLSQSITAATNDEAVKGLENQFGLDLNGDNIAPNVLATTSSDTKIEGAGGDDSIQGANGHDKLYGNGGTDNIDGGSGNDTIDGGTGDDNLAGGTGNDKLYGGEGDDVIDGGTGNDRIFGGEGADTLSGGSGWDTLDYTTSSEGVSLNLQNGTGTGGDAEGDTFSGFEGIAGSSHADTVTGSTGKDRVWAGGGDDIVNTGGSHDYVHAGSGNDTINGGAGNDTINGGAGADNLVGGSGWDRVDYRTSTAGVTINLATGTGSGGDAEGDTFSGFEGLITSKHADVVTGSAGRDAVWAGDGNDVLHGGNNHDRLYGEGGEDTLNGGSGNDTLEGGVGADILDGGAGTDYASYVSSKQAVNINVATQTFTGGDIEGDTFINIEGFIGSKLADTMLGGDGRDRLSGHNGADYIDGGAGHDFLSGGNQNDTLIGGAGNDVLRGESGADHIDGGTGVDRLGYENSNAAVTVDLGTGTGSGGHAAGDTFENVEQIVGSRFNDTLIGDAGNNTLWGNNGNDTLMGGDGYDSLNGGAGADILDGGDSIDWLSYSNSRKAVNVDLTAGTATGGDAQGDQISNIENLYGSKYNDVFKGDAGNNSIHGANGNDIIYSSGGADTLIGGNHADTFILSGDTADNGTQVYGGATNGKQNNTAWKDKVQLELQNLGELLYSADDIDQTDGYLELTDGSTRISLETSNNNLTFSVDEDTGIANINLDSNTDAKLKIDIDNDGVYDTTYNLYDIENITIG